MATLNVYVSRWRQHCYFKWPFEPCEGLPICRQKSVPSFLSYFKTLSIGPGQGIEPQTPCSAVKSSTNGAYPVAVKTASVSQHQNPCSRTSPDYQVLSMPHGVLINLKKGQCLFSWSAWKKIRKHTSGDYLSSLECPEQATLVVLNFVGLQFCIFFRWKKAGCTDVSYLFIFLCKYSILCSCFLPIMVLGHLQWKQIVMSRIQYWSIYIWWKTCVLS